MNINLKKLGNIGGIISGLISIIFSFVIRGMKVGYLEPNKIYGGDAYTGIQNASAQAANNVQALAQIVRTGLFAFLLVLGISLISFFTLKMHEDKPAAVIANTAPAPQVNNNAAYENKNEAVNENSAYNE